MPAIPVVADGNTILAAHHDAIATELNGPWTAYTPALTASSVNPGLGTSPTQTGRWKALATGLVVFNARIIFGTGSPTAGTGIYSVSLPPVNASTTIGTIVSIVTLFDSSSSTRQVGALVIASATTAQIWAHGATSSVTNAAPWTWAASDQINFAGIYEPA